MNNFNNYTGETIRFFHACTDGTNRGIIHFNEKDYHQATNIMALAAHRNNVTIICYCHMSTHSHFVVWCKDIEDARAFSHDYKRDYSRYIFLEYGVNNIMEGVNAEPRLINGVYDLKNCIAYVLNNPVAANLCASPEEYPWSSFQAYFNATSIEGKEIAGLKVRDRRSILRTRENLDDCRFRVTEEGVIVDKSFVDYRFVENLYKLRTVFYRSLAITNSAIEEMKYVQNIVKYSDNEILTEAQSLANKLYGAESLNRLTKSQKLAIVPRLIKRTYASPARIARILRVRKDELLTLLGRKEGE